MASETLYVSAGGENGVPARVLAFAYDANGNAAPDRTIVANGSSFELPPGIVALPDTIFRNGLN